MTPGSWLLAHEPALRLGIFVSLFGLLALLQWRWPLRGVRAPWQRWARHLSLAALGTALVRLCFPVAAVAIGAKVDALNLGLLQWSQLPQPWLVALGIVLMDLAIYWQHRLFHRVPLLWRLHRMHHSDTEFEVSTAIRFHPLEIALSMLIKIGVIVAFGIPALAVLLFEILLNATALFSHADWRLPATLDRRLRLLLVTPDMHRVHHSTLVAETNSNYGFCLAIWDRIFGSLRERPRDEQQQMAIGLERFRGAGEQTLTQQLLQPLRD